ncbi:ABC transporter ATP-binding protein [Rugosimonospora acidiphila]|uniref:ABC transporter ATP-binding protein n=1 Tax=Rugosimonospora acidiphila TaxID=556531 RepID=A0ABP9RMI4_9ACTN
MAQAQQAQPPGTARDPALTLRGVTVRFGGLTALDDVSLEVPEGGTVGIIGPNGAGKTTLFNVICGFVRADAGTITWQDRPLRPRPQKLIGLGIARTLQGIGLFPGLSVLENVMAGADQRKKIGFGSSLLALPRSDRAERELRGAAMARLEEFKIASWADRRPDDLPYPVRKKVALARALVAQPRLLLLDEPAGGLGGEDIEELATLIRSLGSRRGGGVTVMLVEHHMDLVMQVCQRVVVLDFGRVIAAGTPDEIRDDPAVAEAYLGAEAGGHQPTGAQVVEDGAVEGGVVEGGVVEGGAPTGGGPLS